MSLLFFDGMDMYSTATDVYDHGYGYSNLTISTSLGRYGGGCFTTANTFIDANLAAEPTEIYAGVAFQNNGSSASPLAVLRFVTEGGTEGSLEYTASTGTWGLYRGDGTTLLDSVVSDVGSGNWDHIAVHFKPDNTTGIFEFWINGGGALLSQTNIDTRQTSDTGGIIALKLGGSSSSATWRYDDLWITDTAGSSPYNGNLGDCRVITGTPNSDAAPNDGTPVTGPSNYQAVDDAQRSSTDSVGIANTSTNAEWYGTDLALTSADQVLALQPRVVVKKEDAGDAFGKVGIRQSATESYSGDLGLTIEYGELSAIFTEDPISGIKPTYTEANSMDVGYEVV